MDFELERENGLDKVALMFGSDELFGPDEVEDDDESSSEKLQPDEEES